MSIDPFSGRVEEYFDAAGTVKVTRCIETGECRYESIDQPDVPDDTDEDAASAVPAPWSDIADLGVKAIQERLDAEPDVASAVLAWEESQDKPRQGVLDAAGKALGA